MLLFTVRIISMAEAWSPGYRVHLCSYITVQWLGPLDGSRTPSPGPFYQRGLGAPNCSGRSSVAITERAVR